MEKRVERNKKLYQQINEDIEKIRYQQENGDFKDTNTVLSSLNPTLFGDNKEKSHKTSKDNFEVDKKKFVIGSILVVAFVILVIVLVVVFKNGTK